MVYLFMYGTEHYCIRVGIYGSKPLVYGVYRYNHERELPKVPAQTYRSITADQFEWLMDHRMCDVVYISGSWPSLECRTHGTYFKLFGSDPIVFDPWYDRQV
jgi:hypothetical protein